MKTINKNSIEKFDKNNQYNKLKKIEYEIYKYEDKYYRVIYYPFNAKCWGIKTKPNEEMVFNFFKSTFEKKISSIKSRYKKDKIIINFIIFKYYLKNKKIDLKPEEIKKKFIELSHKYDFETIELGGREYIVEKIWQDLNKLKDNEVIKKKIEKIKKEIDEEKIKELLINPVCEYCGITQDEVNKLFDKNKIYTKRNRGYSMEIDKKEPFKGYTKDNIVSCCYWCNNSKSDEFSYEEFKEIAKSIRKIWEKRLKKL